MEPNEFFITVKNAQKELLEEDDNYHVTYAIFIVTKLPLFELENSYIRRRYSEFKQFRKLLAKRHKKTKLPKLPSKGWYCRRFEKETIDRMSEGLLVFMNKLAAIPEILYDKCFQLFTQTHDDMDLIRIKCKYITPDPITVLEVPESTNKISYNPSGGARAIPQEFGKGATSAKDKLTSRNKFAYQEKDWNKEEAMQKEDTYVIDKFEGCWKISAFGSSFSSLDEDPSEESQLLPRNTKV